jgi:hypothetical protein
MFRNSLIVYNVTFCYPNNIITLLDPRQHNPGFSFPSQWPNKSYGLSCHIVHACQLCYHTYPSNDRNMKCVDFVLPFQNFALLYNIWNWKSLLGGFGEALAFSKLQSARLGTYGPRRGNWPETENTHFSQQTAGSYNIQFEFCIRFHRKVPTRIYEAKTDGEGYVTRNLTICSYVGSLSLGWLNRRWHGRVT